RLFEDREGNVWATTTDGLDRFREFSIPTISQRQGFSGSYPTAVQAVSDGGIWIGTTNELNRWANGHIVRYPGHSTLGRSNGEDETKLRVRDATTKTANSGLVGSFRALGTDDAGRLLASTTAGVFYFEGGRFVRVPGLPGGNAYSIAGDGHGNI